MKIQVTQHHIERGKRDNCYLCPVALAISGRFPSDVVEVGSRSILIKKGDLLLRDGRIKSPAIVQDFVDSFDHGHAVEPFEFELPIEASL